VKFIPSHVQFFSKSNSENVIKIYDEVTDKTKLVPFYGSRCIKDNVVTFYFRKQDTWWYSRNVTRQGRSYNRRLAGNRMLRTELFQWATLKVTSTSWNLSKSHVSRNVPKYYHFTLPRRICFRRCFLFVCLFVCLFVNDFAQKRLNGFAWNFQGRLATGRWTND